MLSTERIRRCIIRVRQKFDISERRACKTLGVSRSVQRYTAKSKGDEDTLRNDIIRLASRYGRYGYRRITAMLRIEGWHVNHKRVERIWREEGLKVPGKQKKRGRLYLHDGSCIRLRPCWENHVWSYDFVKDRLHNGKRIKMLTVIDEFSRKCFAIQVARSLTSEDVLETLWQLFVWHGVPSFVRSDNGSEFTAHIVQNWLKKIGAKTAYITPASPWENGFNERFNGSLRDECLNGELFYTVKEARIIIEQWRREYNEVRPHSSLGYRPPAPQARLGLYSDNHLDLALLGSTH